MVIWIRSLFQGSWDWYFKILRFLWIVLESSIASKNLVRTRGTVWTMIEILWTLSELKIAQIDMIDTLVLRSAMAVVWIIWNLTPSQSQREGTFHMELEGYELEQTQSLTASRHLQCYPREALSYLFLLPSWVAFCRICVCLVARVANLVFREFLQPSRRLLFDASTHHREKFDCDAHKHSNVPFLCDAFLNFVCLLLILWGIY